VSLHQKDSGTRVTNANYTDVTDDVADNDPWVVVLEDLVERREFAGTDSTEHPERDASAANDETTLAFTAGQVVRKSEVLAKMTAATVDSFSPATGLNTAGGQTITVKGSGLEVTAVTVGGTAATSVANPDGSTVTFVTPAKASGAYGVTLTDDSGAVTKANALTFS
jgi:hypothetical protein